MFYVRLWFCVIKRKPVFRLKIRWLVTLMYAYPHAIYVHEISILLLFRPKFILKKLKVTFVSVIYLSPIPPYIGIAQFTYHKYTIHACDSLSGKDKCMKSLSSASDMHISCTKKELNFFPQIVSRWNFNMWRNISLHKVLFHFSNSFLRMDFIYLTFPLTFASLFSYS